MSNKESLNQSFIDCAFYGYTDGLKAVLQAGHGFGEATWLEALKSAALGGNSEVVRFLLNQYVMQRRDIAVDSDWLRTLDERQPSIARDIELCDRYVRAEKLRAKLREQYSVQAPEVGIPDFIDRDAKIHDFVETQGAPSTPAADKAGAVFAQSDQFGAVPLRPGARAPDAQAVEQWLAQTKRGAA